jgi:hypothetical protein
MSVPQPTSTQCDVRARLQAEAQQHLKKVIELTQQQIEALARNDQQMLLTLDKLLELTFGEKERSFGALREHTKEHQC